MAVTIFNDGSVVTTSNVLSLTLANFDVGSGSDRVLAAFGAEDRAITTSQTATYNGVAMAVEVTIAEATQLGSTLFSLINPASGMHDLVLTNVGANANCYLTGIALDGVDQTTPVSDTASDNTTGMSASITLTSAVDDLCIDGIIVSVDSPTPDSGQTTRGTILATTASFAGVSSEPGATSVTMGHSWATNKANAYVGGNFVAAAVAGGGIRNPLGGSVVLRNPLGAAA